MRAVVEQVKKKGIKLAIVSDNVPERVDYLEKKYHFLDLFDEVVMSYEENLTKQSEEIFWLTLERLEIKPEEAVFVDDREVNLQVASGMGIKSLLFTDSSSLKQQLTQLI